MNATGGRMVTDSPQPALSPDEVARFVRDGFLGPFAICEPEAMLEMLPAIEAALRQPPPDHRVLFHNRHLDSRLIYDLASHPDIVGRMASLYGPDLLLWRTNFFVKEPGSPEIPMHQDYNYWPLEPATIISAWLAIDPATVENSCVQVLPGSHRRVLPHVKADAGMWFSEMADPTAFERERCVPVPLKPGEFMLFNERTLHGSEPNRSPHRRMGMAIRVTVPIVHVTEWDSPQHGLQRLRGEERMRFNRHVEPPAAAGGV